MLLNIFCNSFKDKTKRDQKGKTYPHVLSLQQLKDRADITKFRLNCNAPEIKLVIQCM